MIPLQSELVHSGAKLKTPGEEDRGMLVVKRGRKSLRGKRQSTGGGGGGVGRRQREGGRGRGFDDRGEGDEKMPIGRREEGS